MDLRALKGDAIESDFFSRDFTINAIYYDIKEDVIRDPGNVSSKGIPRP
jgi:tRNA nucleotidyltransferase/poly(A) polymerase